MKWPRSSARYWRMRSRAGWALAADPIPMSRLADHGPDAAAHAQPVRPNLLNRSARVRVAVGDEDIRAINSGTRGLDVVDDACAEQVRAAARFRLGLLP